MCGCRPLFPFRNGGLFICPSGQLRSGKQGRVAGVLGEESSLSSSREMFWISHAGKNLALVVLPDGAVRKIFFAMRQYDCRMDTRTRSSQWMIFFNRASAGKISEATAAKERKGGLFRQVAVREKGPSPSAGYGDLLPETRRRKNDAFCECEKYPVCQEGMNIYRSCSHGCIYCDSRSLRYQGGHDFEDIEITANPIELLEQSTLKMWIALVVARATTRDRTHGKATLFP